jgi:hypothetical protein
MTPAQRILAQFAGVSDDARQILGESLEMSPAPFLSSLGSALTYETEWQAQAVVNRALVRARWDGSKALLDVLSDSEPWRTVKDVLSELEFAPDAGDDDGE